MKSKLLNITGATRLTKEAQRTILGQAGSCSEVDLSLCGCSCSGSVTGPFYCFKCIACPQVYTCYESI